MPRRRKAGKPELGQYLEWHGAKIRVVVRVPPSLTAILGTKLRKPLNTADPRLAEVLKHSTVQELKATIYRAKHGTKDDPLIREAMRLREEIEKAKFEPLPTDEEQIPTHVELRHIADAIADDMRHKEGEARADLFLGVALGVETPIGLHVDGWVKASDFAPRTEAAMRQAVRKLEDWAKATKGVTPALEDINRKLAARYVEEVFEAKGVNPATANKLLSGLSSYWKWLLKGHRLDPDVHRNPWLELRLTARKRHRSETDEEKRPFTDEEVSRLLSGIRVQPVHDMMRVSLLTGMRLTEIAQLKVGHVEGDVISIKVAKSLAGRREFPLPDTLAAMLKERRDGKSADDFVFHELPTQENGARGRGAPASQAFTRERRKLGVDDHPPGMREARIDFHSCRRWFIRKAVQALERGATGYTPWTIADVVGHDTKTDGPLKLTMGLYPGRADETAMRACLAAVKLPPHVAQEAIERRTKGRPKSAGSAQ